VLHIQVLIRIYIREILGGTLGESGTGRVCENAISLFHDCTCVCRWIGETLDYRALREQVAVESHFIRFVRLHHPRTYAWSGPLIGTQHAQAMYEKR
jgi:hypothetical protein